MFNNNNIGKKIIIKERGSFTKAAALPNTHTHTHTHNQHSGYTVHHRRGAETNLSNRRQPVPWSMASVHTKLGNLTKNANTTLSICTWHRNLFVPSTLIVFGGEMKQFNSRQKIIVHTASLLQTVSQNDDDDTLVFEKISF